VTIIREWEHDGQWSAAAEWRNALAPGAPRQPSDQKRNGNNR